MSRSSIFLAAALSFAISAAQSPAINRLPGLEADALTKVRSWSYQLQAIDLKSLAQSANHLLVIDYSLDGGDGRTLTRDHLASLQRTPDGTRRIVLAYLSIGEAEKYRGYWQTSWSNQPPAWLKQENKNWCGNFIVDFTHPHWHAIIYAGTEDQKSYVDKIVEAGFDGIYLDRVDVYSELEPASVDYRQRMIEFVGAISKTAKAKAAARGSGAFFVIAQNAEELLTSKTYRAQIDALAKEDLLFGVPDQGKPNTEDEVAHSMRLINMLFWEDKPVFGVEYLDRGEEIEGTKNKLSALGLVPLIAPRALDQAEPLAETSAQFHKSSIAKQPEAQNDCGN